VSKQETRSLRHQPKKHRAGGQFRYAIKGDAAYLANLASRPIGLFSIPSRQQDAPVARQGLPAAAFLAHVEPFIEIKHGRLHGSLEVERFLVARLPNSV
jgi:hypothetical protein